MKRHQIKNEIHVPIAVVIPTRNEEHNIRRCIQSVKWAADVLVVDDGSVDRTKEIAEECGARVVSHRFESFARQRNWAMEYGDVRHEWVLHLDADEFATEEVHQEVRSVLQSADDQTVAFRMCRRTLMNGTWLKFSDGFPVWIMRLVRNGRVQFEDAGHGEVAVPTVSGRMGVVRSPLDHHPFSRGLDDWFDRHNRYSTNEALLEQQRLSEFQWRQLLSVRRDVRRAALRSLSRRLPCRAGLRFLYQYMLKLGFLDGYAGLQFCRMMALYEQSIVLKREFHLKMIEGCSLTEVDQVKKCSNSEQSAAAVDAAVR